MPRMDGGHLDTSQYATRSSSSRKESSQSSSHDVMHPHARAAHDVTQPRTDTREFTTRSFATNEGLNAHSNTRKQAGDTRLYNGGGGDDWGFGAGGDSSLLSRSGSSRKTTGTLQSGKRFS